MTTKYILKGKLPVPEPDLLRWAEWFEAADRTVGLSTLTYGFWVSTVFLGIDHGFGRAEPLLFETMVFHEDDGREVSLQNAEGEHLLLFDRYATYGDAEKGHLRIVRRVENWIDHLTNQKICPTWDLFTTNRGDHSSD